MRHRASYIKVVIYEAYCEDCDWSETFQPGDIRGASDEMLGTRGAQEGARRAAKNHAKTHESDPAHGEQT